MGCAARGGSLPFRTVYLQGGPKRLSFPAHEARIPVRWSVQFVPWGPLLDPCYDRIGFKSAVAFYVVRYCTASRVCYSAAVPGEVIRG